MSLTRVDFWIGRTLFVPPIILVCRLTRQSQFAVSRLFWFIAALDGFYQSQTWVSLILFGSLSIFMMILPKSRRKPSHVRWSSCITRVSIPRI